MSVSINEFRRSSGVFIHSHGYFTDDTEADRTQTKPTKLQALSPLARRVGDSYIWTVRGKCHTRAGPFCSTLGGSGI